MSIKSWLNDRASDVSRAASTVSNTVQEKATSLKKTVSEGVTEIKKTTTEAANTLVDVAQEGRRRVGQGIDEVKKDVNYAVDHPFQTLNRAADKLGQTVSEAGKSIEEGSKELAPYVPFAKDLGDIGRTAQDVGKTIQDAPEAAVKTAGEVEQGLQELKKDGQELLHRAEKTVGEGVELAQQGLDKVKSGLDSIGEGVTSFGRTVADSVNYDKQIDKLGNGDKYTLGVGGSGTVEGGKLYGKGKVEVERKGDKYVVSADGEIGGGVYGELGGKAGPLKASGTAEATLGVGGKIEMTFDSPEEAKRGTEILLKMAASQALESSGHSPIPGSGLVTGVASQVIKPSAEEMKFLTDHATGVELKGNVAAELAGTLGVANKTTQLAGLFGKGNVKDEMTAKLTFGKDGNPPTLSFKETLSGELAGGVGLGLSNAKSGDGAGLGANASGVLKGKVEVEKSYVLPNNLSAEQLLQDPVGTINTAANQIQKSRTDKVTVGIEGEGNLMGNSRGFQADLSFSGNADQITNSGALEKALSGDMEGALHTVGNNVQVEGSIKPYSTSGIAMNPGISLMGFGVGIEAQATRQDFADKPTWQFKGNANEAAAGLNEELQRGIQFIQENPELLRAGGLTARSSFPIRG